MNERDTKANHPAAVWVRRALELNGVRVLLLEDGSTGLVDVPAKWAGVIATLGAAIGELHEGRPLPELKPKKRGP